MESAVSGGEESSEGAPVGEPGAQAPVLNSLTSEAPNIERNEVDDSPAWYDPIYNQIFTDLRNKFKEQNPVLFMSHKEGMYSQGMQGQEAAKELAKGNRSQEGAEGAAWQLQVGACPVLCGGGWTEVGGSGHLHDSALVTTY